MLSVNQNQKQTKRNFVEDLLGLVVSEDWNVKSLLTTDKVMTKAHRVRWAKMSNFPAIQ
jgi:hypothetical protein